MEKVAESWLTQGIGPAMPGFEPGGIALETGHAISQVREDGRGDRAHVARADDRHAHGSVPIGLMAGVDNSSVPRSHACDGTLEELRRGGAAS